MNIINSVEVIVKRGNTILYHTIYKTALTDFLDAEEPSIPKYCMTSIHEFLSFKKCNVDKFIKAEMLFNMENQEKKYYCEDFSASKLVWEASLNNNKQD